MQRLVKSSRRRTGCRQWISNGSERGVPDRTVARQTQPRTLAGGTWIAGLEAGAVAPAAKSAQRTERWAGRAADQCGAVHLPVPRSDDLHSSGSTNRTALLAAARAPTLRLPPGPRGRHKPPPATSLAGRQVSRDGHTRDCGTTCRIGATHSGAAWARNFCKIGVACSSDQPSDQRSTSCFLHKASSFRM